MTNLLKCLFLSILLYEVCHGYRITYSSSSGLYQESADTGEVIEDQESVKRQFLINQGTEEQDEWMTKQRLKRKAIVQEISYERKQPGCMERLKQMRKYQFGPVTLALYVEVGEMATFTCHYCTKGTARYASMLWRRLRRHMENGVYQVDEVLPDMHDDESRNRIVVGIDHTLTIKEARIGDEGIYFCHDTATNYHEQMSMIALTFLLSDPHTFRFHYHFDVVRPAEMKPREVSRQPGKESMAPLQPHIYKKKNVKLMTVWQKWGPCSVCDSPGVRKRLGVCTLTRNEDRISEMFLERLLRTYQEGLPCRLTFFKTYPESITRPDEIEEEPCNIECPLGANLFKSNTMSVDGIKTSIKFDQEKKTETVQTLKVISVSAGEAVNMSCPGVPVDWAVVWTNNSRIVDANVSDSDSRVRVHPDNMLEINPALVQDSATYRCVSRDQVKARVTLTVTVRIVSDKATWLYAYFMTLTFPGDFLIFLVLMIIKHRHRRAGRRLTNQQLREIESVSSLGSRRGSRRYLSSQTDASRRYLSSQTNMSRQYLSSQTDISIAYFSSQTDASRRYVSSQSDASRRYVSSQTDASRRYVSRQSQGSRQYITSQPDAIRGAVPHGDDLSSENLLSLEASSSESERILACDVINTSQNYQSESFSDSEVDYQSGLSRRHNHNVNAISPSSSSLETISTESNWSTG